MSRTTPWFTLHVPSFVAVVTTIAIALWPARAQAQDAAQAETLFTKAKRLMAEGRIAEACESFAASEKLDPSPSTRTSSVTLIVRYDRRGSSAAARACAISAILP